MLTDPRFLLGLALIIVSVLGTTWIVQKARSGENLYQLTTAVAEGSKIDISSLSVVSARTSSDAYLRVGELPEDAIATRTLNAGEFLPRAAVSSEVALQRRQVVINVATRIPSSVAVGSKVEVWAVDSQETTVGQQSDPKIITSSAIILAISSSDSGLLNSVQSVEISIPQSDLDTVLLATGSKVSLVVVPAG